MESAWKYCYWTYEHKSVYPRVIRDMQIQLQDSAAAVQDSVIQVPPATTQCPVQTHGSLSLPTSVLFVVVGAAISSYSAVHKRVLTVPLGKHVALWSAVPSASSGQAWLGCDRYQLPFWE